MAACHSFQHDAQAICRRAAMLLCAAAIGMSGCGGEAEVPRYSLSGTVTLGDQPVPGGRIMFVPDSRKNNKGPGTVAEIQDGRYATPNGKGVIGGPHVISIYGTDGTVATESRSNTLFDEYQVQLDLRRADATHDFRVPIDR